MVHSRRRVGVGWEGIGQQIRLNKRTKGLGAVLNQRSRDHTLQWSIHAGGRDGVGGNRVTIYARPVLACVKRDARQSLY